MQDAADYGSVLSRDGPQGQTLHDAPVRVVRPHNRQRDVPREHRVPVRRGHHHWCRLHGAGPRRAARHSSRGHVCGVVWPLATVHLCLSGHPLCAQRRRTSKDPHPPLGLSHRLCGGLCVADVSTLQHPERRIVIDRDRHLQSDTDEAHRGGHARGHGPVVHVHSADVQESRREACPVYLHCAQHPRVCGRGERHGPQGGR